MSQRTMITSGDIAEMMGLQNGQAFMARRAKLEAVGFPKPVFWSQKPYLWKRPEVEFWIDHQHEITTGCTGPAFDAENVVMMAKARVA